MSRIQRLVKPTQHIFNWKISIVLTAMLITCLTVLAQDKTTHVKSTSSITAINAPSPISAVSTVSAINAVAAVAAKAAVKPVAPVDAISHSDSHPHETYAVVIAGKKGMMISGNVDDVKNIEAVKKTQPGNFLWFKRDNKDYIVQDPKVIAQVQAAWRDADKLSAEMDALSAKMDLHSAAMDTISHKMDAVSTHGTTADKAMEKISRDMDALSMKQDGLGKK